MSGMNSTATFDHSAELPEDDDDDLGELQGDVAVIRTPVRQYQPASDGNGDVCFVLERETVLTTYRWMPHRSHHNGERRG